MSSRQVGGAEPSEKQLDFARDLGIVVPFGAQRRQVSQLITKEVRRRGREVVRVRQLKPGCILEDPVRGLCEVVRVGVPTMKVTLFVANTGRKTVVDAMHLTECPVA